MEYKHKLPSLEEVKNNRPILRDPISEGKLALTTLESFALVIAKNVGSMGFFIILTMWSVGWLLWNVLAPVEFRFDPAPGFVIWLFVSNLIQLILLPLLMVSQNIEGKVADQRAEADFEVNKKSEKEIELIIGHLENQDELLMEILKRLKTNNP